MLNQEAETEGILKQTKENGLGIRAYSPLAWLLNDDMVSSVIVGASLVEQLGQNMLSNKNSSSAIMKLR